MAMFDIMIKLKLLYQTPVGYEVLPVVMMKCTVFWIVTPYGSEKVQCSEGTYCLNLLMASYLIYSLTVFVQIAWCYSPEDCTLHIKHHP
jgi:hypothetical protein